MIAIVDYGMGNLRSVLNAFEAINAPARLTTSIADLREASAIVVPGVGAFGDGMRNLTALGVIEALAEEVLVRKKPYLGICLGMQFLAREGREHGVTGGLGWLGGVVRRLAPGDPACKVPHMGWNDVAVTRECELFRDIDERPVFYFLHGFQLDPAGEAPVEAAVVATASHGERVTAAVQRDNVFGVQFHPEKSQEAGLQVLRNFTKLA
jgi:imidazole glycerol-phosphate synthase subunit HisH